MRTNTLLTTLTVATQAWCLPQFASSSGPKTNGSIEGWEPAGSGDARGPCPGLNTLANHHYLPHDGREITLEKLGDAMLEGFNVNKGDARILFTQAVRTNPSYPLARSFDLDTLGTEGVLEHDISLSRADRYFADPLPFNETVWEETFSYFTEPMITVQQLADARMGRLATSKATNPEHTLSALGSGFSWGECASFFEIMADGTTGTVDKKFIDYWFRNERMPTEIGWSPREITMQGSERVEFSRKLKEAGGEGSALSGLSGLSGSGLGGLLSGGGSSLFGRRFVH